MTLSVLEREKLVSGICEEKEATRLLENVFKNPKEPGIAKEFSDALNETILREQKKTGDRTNLLLPINRVRYIFAKYVNSCINESYISDGLLVLKKTGGSDKEIENYEATRSRSQDDQQHFRKEWDSWIDNKGYPSSWKNMFAKHSESQMEDHFDNYFLFNLGSQTLRELIRNIGLRQEIWGEISFDKDAINSWNYFWAHSGGELFPESAWC
jgi:hypothetical protein